MGLTAAVLARPGGEDQHRHRMRGGVGLHAVRGQTFRCDLGAALAPVLIEMGAVGVGDAI